ncbi:MULTISPECIES: hypothetical protein [Bradyrhizobium]|jgi:hypothetical protein|uniref:hypothetical protein n=1 Tax=Bradyrhizobium TaxID=374 RepID=UPI0004AD68C8|nr:hypothetical protein [Bradyrhizobium elkanii]MCS3524561.1 hypothetical protein [Bradyrhizobium elkanii]MCS4072216.1 hypothetical protein [Bradyrhizobium elkanii]MCS4078850.1 hypothetical protein [Bradyrhizobium elkanii]MCW2122552.1 hypothetical protein [Bradyrhizobium elkanii]MCW2169299.1 hypothetical protein [Bradyrhizobium elkanii]
MDADWIEPAIAACLKAVHAKLKEAERIARAAAACAETGSVSEGVQVSMEIEQLIYDAGRLQDAASLFRTLLRT